MRLALILILPLVLMGSSRCSNVRLKPDTSELSAMEANDMTVFIEGCDSPPKTGFNFCRVSEGQETQAQKLIFIVPPALCKSDKSCVSLKIIFPTDRPSLGFEVPKGNVRFEVPWKDILERDTFEKNDRGLWGVVQEWKWIDLDRNEQTSISQGFVYMRVIAKGHEPLNNTRGDPNFAWRWVTDGVNYNLTTQGRASLWR